MEHTDEVGQRIERAVARRREEWSLSGGFWADRAVRNLSYFHGEQHPEWAKAEVRRSYIVKNVLRTYVKVVKARYATAPSRIRAHARAQEWADVARMASYVGQFEWDMNHVGREMDKCRYDRMIFGYSGMLVGWQYDPATSENVIARAEAEYGLPPGEFIFKKTMYGTDEVWHVHTDPETGEVVEQPMPEATMRLRAAATVDDLSVEHVSALNIFLDPIETDPCSMTRSRFIVWREYQTKAQVEDDDRNKLPSDGVTTVMPGQDTTLYTYGETPLQEDLVELWHYVGEDPEKPGKQIHTVRVGSHYQVLRESEWTLPFWPLVLHSNDADPGYLYPLSEIDECIIDQDEINQARTDQHNHRKRFDRVYFTVKGTLDEEAIATLQEAEDGEVIGVDLPPGQSLENVLYPAPTAQLQPEAYSTKEESENWVKINMSATDYDLGSKPPGRTSATESMNIIQRSAGRAAEGAERDRQFRTAIVNVMLDTIVAMADPVRPRRYYFLGPEGERIWQNYALEDLKGDFEIEVEVVDNSQESIQKLINFLQIIQPYTSAGINPQTMQPLFPDPETGGVMIPNIKPAIEKLILLHDERPETYFTAPQTPAAAPQLPPQGPAMGPEQLAMVPGGMNG